MKIEISNLLKSSLEQERKALASKTSNTITNRFIAAEALFNDIIVDPVAKINVIRDTFTLPENDYELINICRAKLLDNKISATKSEVIRAGLIMLSKIPEVELIKSYNAVDKIKTGRPKNH